ncbi:MAG: hypothetical protein ACHQ49_16495 [Elusimicrobiota bacterium]
MFRRVLPLLVLACAASGCASVEPEFSDAPPPARAPARALTADQAYNAGVLDAERGDYDAARREWDLCLKVSAPGSPSRLDCMVALENGVAPPAAARP